MAGGSSIASVPRNPRRCQPVRSSFQWLELELQRHCLIDAGPEDHAEVPEDCDHSCHRTSAAQTSREAIFVGPFFLFFGGPLSCGLLLPGPVLGSASCLLLLRASRFLLCLSTLLAFLLFCAYCLLRLCACCVLLLCASRLLLFVAFPFLLPALAFCFWACF